MKISADKSRLGKVFYDQVAINKAIKEEFISIDFHDIKSA
jgi:hypothetical protein